MEIKASIKNLRISPKKVRLVAGLIRGRKVQDAIYQLQFMNKKSSQPLRDLLTSAIANAEHNFKLSQDNLYIKEIAVNQGLTLKRYTPRAQGRATTIRKKMSHVNLVLAEVAPTGEHKGAKPKKSEVVEVESRDAIHEPVEESTKPRTTAKKASKATASNKAKTIVDPRSEGRQKPNEHADKKGTAKKTSTKKK